MFSLLKSYWDCEECVARRRDSSTCHAADQNGNGLHGNSISGLTNHLFCRELNAGSPEVKPAIKMAISAAVNSCLSTSACCELPPLLHTLPSDDGPGELAPWA